MKLQVVWSHFAERGLDKIVEYYSENATRKIALKYLTI